ncbi:C40 family peptidase [Micromonospora sp. 4G57]|uniref:C40 family peptidase n=1 Tax=Micromonospora sicca TaxID=2202420 RepID=A0ABU5JN12_9ACTN|nr:MULTISPECIES: C40 family peptidase [unclassified Micromonospora]MDZ5447265.1 C40 family peptidase [Micromonospora sp. 4G57]MDZ5493961.1 C40 family peptidase [Micromonospora sp. 4G53]
MSARVLAAVAAGAITVLVLCAGGVAALFTGGGTASAACYRTVGPGGQPLLPTIAASPPASSSAGGWSSEQTANAAVIVAVGGERKVPPRGWVIALATAMQESGLRNLPGGDRDSVGLFQQRPSQGWGTPAELRDPRYAAGTFYTALLAVDGWQAMALTDAAQAVQRSAFPGAYAKWEDDAVALVRVLAGGTPAGPVAADLEQAMSNPLCLFDGGDGQPGGEQVPLPAGFTLPPGTPPSVVTAIGWALAQRGTPYTFGGDCTAPHSGIARHQCDCSSLLQQAYRAAGIAIPRTTSEQVHAGSAVSDYRDLRPGDLLFIPGSRGSSSRPGHVGMYLGQGLIVQAPHSGDVVKISNLSAWSGQLAAVRRVVNQP